MRRRNACCYPRPSPPGKHAPGGAGGVGPRSKAKAAGPGGVANVLRIGRANAPRQQSREGASMTTHVEDLQNLRAQSVQQRRQLVRDLATPGERGGAQDVRELFLKL